MGFVIAATDYEAPAAESTGQLEAALNYADLGYAIVPIHTTVNGRCTCGKTDCKSPGKHPRTPHGLKDASTDPAVIERWFSEWPNSNMAICTDGLLVVDVDPGANGWATPDEHHQLAGAAVQSTPRGGKHLVFRADAPYRCSASRVAEHIDIRADGGYIVVAPSVVNGKPYRWETPLEESQELPEPPGWLRDAVRATERPKATEKPTGDSGATWHNGTRNDALTSLAGRLRRDGLGVKPIEAALQAVNVERCKPPLAASEVASIARSMGRYERGADAVSPKHPIDYAPVSLADLDQMEITTEWLVDYLLVDQQSTILAGPKKCLKTSLAMDLCIALATGGHFMGFFPVPRARRVGFMSGESQLITHQETARRICKAANLDIRGITNMQICERLPRIGELSHSEAMQAFIEDYELEFIAIDPAYMAMPSDDSNNLFAVGDRLRALNDLTDKTGCSFALLHHLKKWTGDDKYGMPELEHIAWSGYQEWARQWLLLNRRQKYDPGSGEHHLWLAAGGSYGHGGAWGIQVNEGTRAEGESRFWDLTIQPAAEVIQAKDNQRDQEQTRQTEDDALAILQFMRREGRVTEKRVRENVKDGTRHTRAWRFLLDSNNIQPAGKIKANNGQFYPAYGVCDE